MRTAVRLACLLGVLALAACGGGSGTDATEPGPTADDGDAAADESASLVVVRYDRNGDALPDVLTVDTASSPFRIVEALEGASDGGAVDASERLQGEAIAEEIAVALANHLADSFALGSETELEVMVGEQPVTVTVVE